MPCSEAKFKSNGDKRSVYFKTVVKRNIHGINEKCSLLQCDAMWLLKELIFWRNVLLPSLE
jgi:hypothetical protein